MVAIGKKLLSLLLVCLATAPLACVNVKPSDNPPKTEVIEKRPDGPKTEVNVNKAPERPKTEVNVNN